MQYRTHSFNSTESTIPTTRQHATNASIRLKNNVARTVFVVSDAGKTLLTPTCNAPTRGEYGQACFHIADVCADWQQVGMAVGFETVKLD